MVFPFIFQLRSHHWSLRIFFGQDPFTGWTTVPPMRSYQHHPVEVGQNDRERNLMVSKMFYFHPYLETWSNLTNIFQMGWNHQLGKIWLDRRSLLDIHNDWQCGITLWTVMTLRICFAHFSHIMTRLNMKHRKFQHTVSVTSSRKQHPKIIEFACWLISWSFSNQQRFAPPRKGRWCGRWLYWSKCRWVVDC